PARSAPANAHQQNTAASRAQRRILRPHLLPAGIDRPPAPQAVGIPAPLTGNRQPAEPLRSPRSAALPCCAPVYVSHSVSVRKSSCIMLPQTPHWQNGLGAEAA